MSNETTTENVEVAEEAVAEASDVETTAEESAEAPQAEETVVEETSTEAEEVAETVETAAAEESASETAADRPTTIAELEPRMKLEGKVVGVKLYGAFVDIGVERPGLLHISQLSNKHVQNVSDVVNEDDDVTVYVLKTDPSNERVTLSLNKPPALTWSEMSVNDVVQGKVVRIEDFGAFVDIGAERPGLIHVSELDNEYVSSVEDKVSLGDVVEARIINVDRRKKQVDLSIRALEAPQAVFEEDDDDEPMTAMAIALQQALQGADTSEDSTDKASKKRSKKKRSSEQSEIIARTLRNSQ